MSGPEGGPPGPLARFAACRSILFVPADRPDRFAKALASGADAVCFDLEDAVAPQRKEVGRAELRALLAGQGADRTSGASALDGGERLGGTERFGGTERLDAPDQGRPLRVVRINDPTSPDGRLDAELLSDGIDAVMIPKVRTQPGLRRAAEMLPAGLLLLPMIETAAGLENAAEIGGGAAADGSAPGGTRAHGSAPGGPTAHGSAPERPMADGSAPEGSMAGGPMPRGSHARLPVAGLVFGGFDLLLELGAEPGWESLLYARSRVVHAASLAGVPAFDMPSRDVHGDLAGVQDETEQARRLGLTGPFGRWRELLLWEEADRARRLGFSGKTVIHPAQLAAVHKAFTPSADAVATARRVMAADRDAAGGPVVLDGRLVDRPIVEAARRTLAKSRTQGSSSGS